MSNTLTPARAISPGRIFQRELNARGWTPKDLAEITGLPTKGIDEIIKRTKQITPKTARVLSVVLGATATFGTNLEAKYHILNDKNKNN